MSDELFPQLFTGAADSLSPRITTAADVPLFERCVVIDHGVDPEMQVREPLPTGQAPIVAAKVGEVATFSISTRGEKPRCHKRSPRRTPRRF